MLSALLNKSFLSLSLSLTDAMITCVLDGDVTTTSEQTTATSELTTTVTTSRGIRVYVFIDIDINDIIIIIIIIIIDIIIIIVIIVFIIIIIVIIIVVVVDIDVFVVCFLFLSDPCVSYPCLNSGTCVRQADSFICKCPPLFTGRLCETEISEYYQEQILRESTTYM